MVKKLFFPLLAVVVAVVVLRPVPVVAATTLTSCPPQAITAAGTYVLGNNLTASAGQTCLVIRGSNITIDGNGKTITVTNAYSVAIQDLSQPASNWSTISVHDLSANGNVQIYGDGVSHVTLERLSVTGIENYAADWHRVTIRVVDGSGKMATHTVYVRVRN